MDFVFLGSIFSLSLALMISAARVRRSEAYGRLFLAAAVGVSGYGSVLRLLIEGGHIQQVPQLIYTAYPLLFLSAPFMYLYVQSLIQVNWTFRRRDALHFIPFCGVAFIFLPFILQSSEVKLEQLYRAENRSLHFLASALLYSYGFTYLFVIAREIRVFRNKVQIAFSDLEGMKLEWLMVIFKTLLAILAARTIYSLLIKQGHVTLDFIPFWGAQYVEPFVTSVGLLAVTISALRQSTILNFIEKRHVDKTEFVDEIASIEKSKPISETEIEKWKAKLNQLMTLQKPYLNPTLTLRDLGLMLGQPAYLVSQVINRGFGCNFYDYVNRWRVEEVKARLLNHNDQHLTILAIAEESGFRSKSVFNSVFKKMTSHTPSRYRASSKVLPESESIDSNV